MKIDEVKLSAVTSATGIRVMAKNHSMTAIPWTAPLPASKPMREDRIPIIPIFKKIGITSKRPNA